MKGSFGLIFFCLMACPLSGQVITETLHLGRPHFEISTPTAYYLYDKAGGGFSSIRDTNGLEWIGFKPGEGVVPGSAAADFRGLPNLVFRGDDNGTGHPGFENCVSEKTAPNQIQTKSKSGLWEWYWTFSEKGAQLEVIHADPSRTYWFLYEGTPGGEFSPEKQFWGNNLDGQRKDSPHIGSPETGKGNWDWAYFGHKEVKQCLVVVHLTPDHLTDNFSYMGSGPEGILSPDGMVVFGLGRDGGTPLMQGPNKFFITLLEYQGSPVNLPDLIKETLKSKILNVL